MELRCGRCNEYLAIAGHGGTCINGHNICTHCYNRPHPPPCVACQIKTTTLTCGSVPEPNTLNRVPHTQANSSPQPVVSPTATPQFQTSANANPQPSVLPSAVSQPYTPPYNTLQPSRTLCSTTEFHTSQETWFRPPAPEESGCQNSTQGMEGRSDVDQMLHNIQMGNSCFRPQQVEQNSDVGQSRTTGTVRQLTEKYDSLGIMTDEGATGWKNQEENARTPQGSSYTLRQQDSIVGCKESQDTQSNTPSLTPPSEGQRTPQQKRYYIRGSPPYPPNILTKDRYLTGPRTREPMPSPSGSTNTFPPPGNRHPSPSTSSAANRHTNPPHSSLRPRDPSPSLSSARNPSRSSSRNRYPSSSSSSSSIRQTNPSRSSSRTREPSPSSINAGSHSRSSSRSRDPSSSHPRISSPSPARQSDRFRSSSSPRDPSCPSSRHSSPSLDTSGSRKSSTPSEATEPSTAPFHSSGAMFSVTHSKGEHANGATSHHTATYEPQLKQPLTPISADSFTYPRMHKPSTTTPMTQGRRLEEQVQWRTEEKGLQGELKVWNEKGDDLQHEELKRRQETQKLTDEGLSKRIDILQQSAMKFDDMLKHKKEMVDVKEVEWALLKEEYAKQQREKDCKHQEELAKLKELSLAQQNQAQEHITALSQENTDLKEEVTALREAKDAQEKEASHWKAKYDKQRAAIEEEMHQFKVQECSRLEKDYDRWALMMTEMQNKVAARDREISQYLEKHNILQKEFQRVQEESIKSKGEASILAMENAQNQKEKGKYIEEVRNLKQEMSAKCTEWEEERNMYTENVILLGGRVDALEKQNLSLVKKEQEYEAALRRSKGDMTCLISERDSCQEEIKKLKKDKEMLKENMAQLRRERDDHQMKLHALENRPLQSPRLTEQISTLLLDIDKLKRREAEQQEEATRLRQERDNSKEEADQLKRKEETDLTELRRERDRYKEEADQLKGKEKTEITWLRQERDRYKEEANQLKGKEETEITWLRQERDKYKEEADQLKRKEETEITWLRQEREKYKEEADQLKRKEETEITWLRQERDRYKEEANQLKGKEETVLTWLRQERDNYKEADQLKKRAETEVTWLRQERNKYKEEADQLKKRAETVIAQLRQERDNYKEDADQIRRKSESELLQMCQERDKYKEEVDQLYRRPGIYQEEASEQKWTKDKIMALQKERDDFKRQVDRLMWSERTQIQQIRGERDKYKWEVDNFKSKEATWEKQMMDLKKERDEYKKTAYQLQMERERGSSRNREDKRDGMMAEAGPRGDIQPDKNPGNVQAPLTHRQPHTSRATEEEEEEEDMAVTQGLPNLGNSCYINSVVQCLYHLPSLRKTLNSNISHLYYQPGTRVALTLAEQFIAMENATEREVCLTTGTLKRVLGSYDVSFSGREQQEAHDLFTAIVSCLHSDLSQHDGHDTSPSASSLFGGQLETSMVCLETFKPLTHTSEAFTSLSLPVVGSSTRKLKDLLDNHFREQKMDWDCEHCHFTHKCSHNTHICRCPSLLVIHFSRVANFNTTWKAKVKFPIAGLSLQSYVARDAPRSPQYQLVGVVCHTGSMASGHYVAYCKHRSGHRSRKWWLCNDSQVWNVEERRVLEDENAHMLFYVQQKS